MYIFEISSKFCKPLPTCEDEARIGFDAERLCPPLCPRWGQEPLAPASDGIDLWFVTPKVIWSTLNVLMTSSANMIFRYFQKITADICRIFKNVSQIFSNIRLICLIRGFLWKFGENKQISRRNPISFSRTFRLLWNYSTDIGEIWQKRNEIFRISGNDIVYSYRCNMLTNEPVVAKSRFGTA